MEKIILLRSMGLSGLKNTSFMYYMCLNWNIIRFLRVLYSEKAPKHQQQWTNRSSQEMEILWQWEFLRTTYTV